MVYFEQEKPS